MSVIVPKQCRVCKTELNRHEAIRGICMSPDCRRSDIPFQLAKREQSILADITQLSSSFWSGQLSHKVAYVPANTQPIEALPEQRQKAICKHIVEIVHLASSDKENQLDTPVDRTATRNGISESQARLPLLGSLCSLCEGYCCSLGGDTAFLVPGVIRRVMELQPDLTIEQIENQYLSSIPEQHYRGSCVFHAASGCALPRELRSRVCNDFICEKLANTVVKCEGFESQYVVAAVDGQRVERLAKVDGMEVHSVKIV